MAASRDSVISSIFDATAAPETASRVCRGACQNMQGALNHVLDQVMKGAVRLSTRASALVRAHPGHATSEHCTALYMA